MVIDFKEKLSERPLDISCNKREERKSHEQRRTWAKGEGCAGGGWRYGEANALFCGEVVDAINRLRYAKNDELREQDRKEI